MSIHVLLALAIGIAIGSAVTIWRVRQNRSSLQRLLNELGHDHLDEIIALTAALEGEEIVRLFHRFGRRWRTLRIGIKRLDNELCDTLDSFHDLKNAWEAELEKVLVKIREAGSDRVTKNQADDSPDAEG